jgi:hypothetical protein
MQKLLKEGGIKPMTEDDDGYNGNTYQQWLAKRHSKSKLAMADKLHHWRSCDYEDYFKSNDKGAKGYLNSKEQRAMLTDAGITMMKTFEIVKPEKYMNLDQICNVIESMVPHESLPDRVLRMFKHYDRTESADGRLTGFVSEDTFIAGIGEHGLTEEEFFIFLTPFKRNDDKVEYARLIEHLFPQDAPLPK